MKTGVLLPFEEYLRTTYHPDCDYVDGEILERNMGERDHSRIQRELIFFFRNRQETWNVFVFPGQREQRAWAYNPMGSTEIKDGVLRTEHPLMTVPLAEIFG